MNSFDFELTRKEVISDFNCTGNIYEYRKFHTKLIFIRNEKDFNLFSANFLTLLDNNIGIAHMTEHLTLSGSERYPIPNLFFELQKKSISKNMGAETNREFTSYYFCSPIEQDFMNILDVYLDCLFHPLLSKFDYMRECHCFKFEDNDKEKELKHTGVIYNEQLGKDNLNILKYLYPDSNSFFNPGGETQEIPKARLEQIREYHAKYYHPSNAYFIVVGNIDINKVLEKISHSIQKFEKIDKIFDQKRFISKDFEKRKRITVDVQRNSKNYTFSLMFRGPFVSDLNATEDVNDVLSLLYPNLQKSLSEIGAQCSVYLNDDSYQTTIFINVKVHDKRNKEAAEKMIYDEFEKFYQNGFDKNYFERLLEKLRSFDKTIKRDTIEEIILPWIHGADPFDFFKITEFIEKSKAKMMQEKYYGNIVKKYLIDNKNVVYLEYNIVDDLNEKENELIKTELKNMKSKMTDDMKNKIVEDGIFYENELKKEKHLELLPSLSAVEFSSDINFVSPSYQAESIKIFSNETNGKTIVQILLQIPDDMENLHYLTFIPSIFQFLECGNLKPGEQEKLIKNRLEGLQINNDFLYDFKDNKYHHYLTFCSKFLYQNSSDFVNLLDSMINQIHYERTEEIEGFYEMMKENLERIGHNLERTNAKNDVLSKIDEDYQLFFKGSFSKYSLSKLKELFNGDISKFLAEFQTVFHQFISNSKLRILISCEEMFVEQSISISNHIIEVFKKMPKTEYKVTKNSTKIDMKEYDFISKTNERTSNTYLFITLPNRDVITNLKSKILVLIAEGECIFESVRAKYGCYTTGILKTNYPVLCFITMKGMNPFQEIQEMKNILSKSKLFITEDSLNNAKINILLDMKSKEQKSALTGLSNAVENIDEESFKEIINIYSHITLKEMIDFCNILNQQQFYSLVETNDTNLVI
ncbi:Clan ME, family M16, insulinase-like metallopeptidase [Trichomonas vaginalis G3]|uniref:Clan ME, family M16, insulinase-like metallopeptidase n=1 Tax=Trichomonas vaginalis (strain ATCC PRA-98 / G3) TaxID=412133 RepID=A2G6B8_TRIV3|nr:metallopeptidase protein [Trichomonas vaginalis G3]EAX87293.1 Clan ME, family M16, insulinase-like metallopeptidase [Trichomonas vaginalis G3]KAI5512669.1 metallopeptidase protein [Trichomonas vaginalis G3]|eukprot:XP_001300223.1 Clan ME, family M16, insulinase-like metallopeptidase [Trichomonas vaginalis G3]